MIKFKLNMTRDKCVLCESQIKEIYRINEMPSFMGVVDDNDNVIKSDMIISECTKCGLIQNKELLPIELVYMNNHNTAVVGDIWIEHYIELCNFIKKNSKGDTILEIGDPSAKLAIPLKDGYKKWIIVEPNTDMESFDNVEIINEFFDGESKFDDEIGTIVHSHVLEHLYDPIRFLKDCYTLLKDGDVTIFSIPNIKWILENDGLPTSVLHFEHTYYVDDENIEYFLNKSGFKLDKIQHYKNHSLFIKAIKVDSLPSEEIPVMKLSEKFLLLVDSYEKKISHINKELNGRDYYLYSAHINSQFMLNNGISGNIISLLDKSGDKIGKNLYGYDYNIYSPERIKNDKQPIVVASQMSIYFEEIKSNLLYINENTIIL